MGNFEDALEEFVGPTLSVGAIAGYLRGGEKCTFECGGAGGDEGDVGCVHQFKCGSGDDG